MPCCVKKLQKRQLCNCGSAVSCAACSTTRNQQQERARFNTSLLSPAFAPALPTLSPSTSANKLDVFSLIDAALAVMESDTLDDINVEDVNINNETKS